ncbi:MAG: flavodoxin-dependent (E)-4-hydroxy-3-methylbut-2-enyl-diphosphate synthase [Oligoflexia bacterium]|nr:flavodoxin-dependent (E)-4-hydroxy-3-methylbut-2-enyl-diphosphate synthase [Oligoflexia bacterium]
MNAKSKITRRPTRSVKVRDLLLGSQHPIAIQSMCATKTQNIEATLGQIELLLEHGADIIRVAVDSKRDVEALAEIRKRTKARLVVDLQESYRLASLVAPHVDKIRYNPGHLHHHEKDIPVFEKVKFIVDCARQHELALRIGINFGSLDPSKSEHSEDSQQAALKSCDEHIEYMDRLGFENYVVSLKSSDPNAVISLNKAFAERHPMIPIHLGVTEAGMLPMGEIKTRVAFENLLALGIGDTLRVSLTLPFERKFEEILVGRKIVDDVYAGRFRSVPKFEHKGLNLISCPSCSRVENEAFVKLAEQVREISRFAQDENITIAVMGCRVNGPGETDDADLGLWCAPKHVNLKRRGTLLGAFSYEEILGRVKEELDALIAAKRAAA